MYKYDAVGSRRFRPRFLSIFSLRIYGAILGILSTDQTVKGRKNMKTFTYTITDPTGIHARPAGMLAKKAKEFQSSITVEKSGKSVSATKLIMLMGLGVKCGDTVTVTADGADEEAASAAMEEFFKENL